jgi:hypothetical protein
MGGSERSLPPFLFDFRWDAMTRFFVDLNAFMCSNSPFVERSSEAY